METLAAPADRYDSRTIALHWLTAALVIGLCALGQTIDFFHSGVPRISARGLRICFDVLTAAVPVYRIGWRLGAATRLPTPTSSRLDALAPWVHKGLYLLFIGTVLLGLANAWVRGDRVFESNAKRADEHLVLADLRGATKVVAPGAGSFGSRCHALRTEFASEPTSLSILLETS